MAKKKLSKNTTVILPTPHNGQKTIRKESRRFNWLSAGRRWRKTSYCMSVGVEALINGGKVIWTAPTFHQVRIGWDEVQKAVGHVKAFKSHVQRMTWYCPSTGGQIIFRSLDNPDNARGYTADGVIIDEVGDVKQDAWYQVLRPMLMDTNGWLWAVGTPKGRNWFWREWGAAPDREDSISWQVPTVGAYINDNGELVRKPNPLENPDIPYSEIEHMFATTPIDSFKQEVLAEFLENEGSVFRNILANLNAPKTLPGDHKDHRVVMGVDWGKQNDFTAVSVGCKTCGHELEIMRFNKIDYDFQRDRIKTLHSKWGATHIRAEANAMGLPNIDALRRDGLNVMPFDTTTKSKKELIERMVLSFDKVSFQFIDEHSANIELEAYERIMSPLSGLTRYSAPHGLNDDTVIARALMLKGLGGMSLPQQKEMAQKSKWLAPSPDFGGGESKWKKFAPQDFSLQEQFMRRNVSELEINNAE